MKADEWTKLRALNARLKLGGEHFRLRFATEGEIASGKTQSRDPLEGPVEKVDGLFVVRQPIREKQKPQE